MNTLELVLLGAIPIAFLVVFAMARTTKAITSEKESSLLRMFTSHLTGMFR